MRRAKPVMRLGYRIAWGGLAPDPGIRPSVYAFSDPPVAVGDVVDLPAVPRAPYAHDVFTPEEMDRRIADLSARLLAADPGPEPKGVCWACGALPPEYVGRGGRVRRGLNTFHHRACPGYANAVETYCLNCFARWGWPDYPDQE